MPEKNSKLLTPRGARPASSRCTTWCKPSYLACIHHQLQTVSLFTLHSQYEEEKWHSRLSCNQSLILNIISPLFSLYSQPKNRGISQWLRGKEFACQAGNRENVGSIPGLGRTPWRRKWQPTPVVLPEKSHRQRSLVGYSPWNCKEWDTTEHAYIKREGVERMTGEGNGTPLQYSCLENPMDGGAW